MVRVSNSTPRVPPANAASLDMSFHCIKLSTYNGSCHDTHAWIILQLCSISVAFFVKFLLLKTQENSPLRLLFRVPPISTYIRTFLGQSLRAAYMTQHVNRTRVKLTVQSSITPGKSYMMCSLTSISDIWNRTSSNSLPSNWCIWNYAHPRERRQRLSSLDNRLALEERLL